MIHDRVSTPLNNTLCSACSCQVRTAETNLLQEASMSNLIKRLSKAVCSHVISAYVLKHDTPILDLILDVVVVNIDVFSALMVALACHELDGGQVVSIELDGTEIVAKIANLLQQASKPLWQRT
jgi:hypothetical protein